MIIRLLLFALFIYLIYKYLSKYIVIQVQRVKEPDTRNPVRDITREARIIDENTGSDR